MNERDFFTESQTTKPATLNCPYCRTPDTYDLRWVLRQKRAQLVGRATPEDRAKFQKAQSYMVLVDDHAQCKNGRCRRRFEVSGIKTMAFV